MSAAAEYKDEGTKYFKAKQYAEAVRSYTSAIGVESDPVELAKLLGNRSTSYGLLNKHVEALSDAKRALQQDANYLKGYFRQATALMNLSRFAEAGAAAAEGLRHEPNNKQLQQLQQEAKAKAPQSSSDMGDDSDDIDDDDLEDDDEDDEDDMDEDEDDEDDEDDEPMVAAPPTPVLSPAEQAEQRKEAGNVLYKQGDYEGAVRLYTAAIRAAPTNPAYLLNRAAALLMLQRAGDALGDAQASLALDATLKAHARVAKCLLQLGRFSDARRQLEGAKDFPNAQARQAPHSPTPPAALPSEQRSLPPSLLHAPTNPNPNPHPSPSPSPSPTP
jgi:tetratricopeptide (TPR) repeat protein